MLASGYQLPQAGNTTSHRKQLPHQRAKAANGGKLPPRLANTNQLKVEQPPYPTQKMAIPETGERPDTPATLHCFLMRQSAQAKTTIVTASPLP